MNVGMRLNVGICVDMGSGVSRISSRRGPNYLGSAPRYPMSKSENWSALVHYFWEGPPIPYEKIIQTEAER